MVAILCWEKIPTLHFCGTVVMWSTLMLALENPYTISTKRLKVGNNIHWLITRTIRSLVPLSFLSWFFTAWSNPRSAVGPVPFWHGSYSQKYCLLQAMSTTRDLLSYNQAGSHQSMTLVENLVLSGSRVVYHQRLHHMPEYIEWFLGVMYSVGGKTPAEYAQREILLWECILFGLVFPYSIGINHANFLPIDESPFLPFTLCWLPSVWLIYTAVAKVLIQLCLGLEAIAT
ncbi:hypothetical protein DSO57_1034103 [Entomophthora muscae]|uniref:Uncharacterized protein n=1 Tax=Entomophthora muscae TaxID=34485 RepID=A0ACC2SNT9_9FUNG|nr:hypothetical protein DSO57_1034103 [Entomophthora muscae]